MFGQPVDVNVTLSLAPSAAFALAGVVAMALLAGLAALMILKGKP